MSSGRTALSRACHVRGVTRDDPSPFHAFGGICLSGPLNYPSEGSACQVRGTILDCPWQFGGHDKRAPPSAFPFVKP
jgi:hypothetical protein